MRFVSRAILAASLTLTALPAMAHEPTELDAFVESYHNTPPSLWTIEDIEIWQDMADRHPWYFSHPPASPQTARPAKAYIPPGRGMGTNVEQWRDLVASYFPALQVDNALCVMLYESGGNPDAKNPRSSARGLFQILASLWAPHFGVSYEALYDPTLNTSLAAQIYALQGWGAWSAWRKCH